MADKITNNNLNSNGNSANNRSNLNNNGNDGILGVKNSEKDNLKWWI